MKIWNQVQTLYATAKTAGTFNDFTEFKLRKGVKNILGFYGVVIDAKPTDGENGIPIFRINSSDLGISNLDLVGAGLIPDGDAATTTNNHQKVWYPWSPKLPANADNVGITFSISAAVSKTEGFGAGIQLII